MEKREKFVCKKFEKEVLSSFGEVFWASFFNSVQVLQVLLLQILKIDSDSLYVWPLQMLEGHPHTLYIFQATINFARTKHVKN